MASYVTGRASVRCAAAGRRRPGARGV